MNVGKGWSVAMRGGGYLGLVVSAGLLTGALGCDHRGSAQGPQAPERPPAMVTLAETETRDVPLYLDEIGKMVPVETVAIVPQVGGKLIAVHVTDGAYVNKGDLLFEIDPRPFQAALDSAQATVAQTTAELEWAKIEENRVKGLFNESSATQFEYDQKRVGVEVARSKLAGAEAAVESAKLDLEYSKIYSPIDGRAGARLVDVGNVVRANDRTLLVIQRLDPIYAEFTITENELGTVRKHMVAAGLTPVSAEDSLRVQVEIPTRPTQQMKTASPAASQPASGPAPAESGGASATQPATPPVMQPATQPANPPAPPREGRLTFLDNAVQTGSGTVRLRATMANADRHFWPGQFVNVRLILAMQKNAVMMPAQAQQIGQQGPFVYVVGADNVAQIRPIVVGQRHGDMVSIVQGLAPGEKVIMTGQMLVMPGAPVMVLPPGGMPPGAPGGPPGAPPGAPGSPPAGHPQSAPEQ